MGDVINLRSRRKPQESGATLYIDHANGKIYGSPTPPKPEFGDRLERIRASMEKINRLMADLKSMSEERSNVKRDEIEG